MSQLAQLKQALRAAVDSKKAEFFPRFFRSGPGEYGEGDKFLGITVPQQRAVARQHKDLALQDIVSLLKSPWHEERLAALFILVTQYKKADTTTKRNIYDMYLANTKYVNNWDLVDSSAHYIVGHYLLDKNRSVLYRLAKSNKLWEKRIAIIATYYFIRHSQLTDTYKIAELLLNDNHDLIHKAVGWMLREAGKRNVRSLERFLDKHAAVMPRTMLRYALEKFPPTKRKKYMKAKFEI